MFIYVLIFFFLLFFWCRVFIGLYTFGFVFWGMFLLWCCSLFGIGPNGFFAKIGFLVNIFVDCGRCGSEFVVDEGVVSSRLRCPDCLCWVDVLEELPDRDFVMSFSSHASFDDGLYGFDDRGFDPGYDY